MSLPYLFSVSGDGVLTNGGRDDAAATIEATMTADRSYTQLSDEAPLAAESHLGCNGTCSGGSGKGGGPLPIPRDASMSTQVVVLSPATPSEEPLPATGGEEGKGLTHQFCLWFWLSCQIANRAGRIYE